MFTNFISNKIFTSVSLVLILNLVFQLAVNSQTEEDYKVLKIANKEYTEGEYQQAVELYEKLVKAGFSAPELYYNLGNAYYRVGNYKAAILNYERAKLINPDDENVLTNLEYSQRYIQDKIESVPKFFLINWLEEFTNLFTAKTWAIFSIIGFMLCLAVIILFLFSKSLYIRKLSFYIGILSIFISFVSFYGSYKQNQKMTRHNTAIVFSPSVTVKSSPNENGTDLFIIHEGLKVTITDRVDGWKEIKLSDGKLGWLADEDIVEI